MNLEQLQNKLDNDLKIDALKLQYEASNAPVLNSQWLRIYSDTKKQIMLYEHKKKLALKQRLDFYTGRGDEICPDLYSSTELKTVIAADESIASIDLKLQMYNLMLDFCSRALEMLKQRGFSIKAMIDIRMLESGK